MDDDDDRRRRNYTRYYDTPDGVDVDKKIGVTTRYGVLAGLIISTYDVLMFSHATGFGAIMARYAKHTVPLALMGATFAAVANGAQHLREKNDNLNYFLGGLACGPILASYVGSMHAVIPGGLVLGFCGMLKKEAIDNGWTLMIPTNPSHMGTVRSWRNDYTLARDPRDEMIEKCSDEE